MEYMFSNSNVSAFDREDMKDDEKVRFYRFKF